MGIRWYGGAVLIGTLGIALLLQNANAGDRIVKEVDRVSDLSPGQLTGLRSIVLSIFPTATANNVDRFGCERSGSSVIVCSARETKQASAATYFQDLDTNPNILFDSFDGNVATYYIQRTSQDISASQRTALSTFASAVFPSANANNIIFMGCAKVGSEYPCTAHLLKTYTESEALQTLQSKPGSRIVGKVE